MKPPAGILALAMGKPKGPPMAKAPAEEEEAPDSESGGSEMEFFKLASEASASGDHEAAAKALASGVKACMGSYGGEK